jgi:nucleotide-binding universal stress UspA family protein
MFTKILLPTDGSALALKAAEVATKLAQSQGAQIIGLYVIDPFPFTGVGDASAVGLQAYMSEVQGAAGRALADVRTLCEARGVSFAGDTIERGSTYEGILETAKAEACDLIVMGSHGRKGVQALILGSVAQQVLTHSSLPVMVIKG